MSDFERRAADHQARLDGVLGSRDSVALDFDDATFPFRYASGGVLPQLLVKPYVAYECRSFHLDVLRGRKEPRTYTVSDGVDHAYLPLLLPAAVR